MNPHSVLGGRGAIYLQELAATAGLLASIAVAARITMIKELRKYPSFLPTALLVLSAVDLLLLGRNRLISVAPLRPLTQQSPVLATLASEPRGARIVAGLRNLPMLIGLGPVSAYRTLDLPALEPLTRWQSCRAGTGELGLAVQKARRRMRRGCAGS